MVQIYSLKVAPVENNILDCNILAHISHLFLL